MRVVMCPHSDIPTHRPEVPEGRKHPLLSLLAGKIHSSSNGMGNIVTSNLMVMIGRLDCSENPKTFLSIDFAP